MSTPRSTAISAGVLALIALLLAAQVASARVLTVSSERGVAKIALASDVENNPETVRSIRACDTDRDGERVFAIMSEDPGRRIGLGTSEDANGAHNRCGDRVPIRSGKRKLFVSICSSAGPGRPVKDCVSSTVRQRVP
jgi:hypothetical protein